MAKIQRGQPIHKSDIRQTKALGQVFLNTDWPVKKIVEQVKSLGIQAVIEIGPGKGILTFALAEAGVSVTAIEKDNRFAERLHHLTSNDTKTNIEVINTDVLEFDLGSWIEKMKKSGTKIAVLGNIPYNISTPIIMWMLPHLGLLTAGIFMVQLEFAQRIVSSPDSKSYGSLSVFCQLRSICEFNFEVGKSCFTPIPKVDSAVITMKPRSAPVASSKLMQYTETVCRIAFTLRRKKLRNGVKPFMAKLKEEDSPIDLNRRAETLSPGEFVDLAAFLFSDKLS
jgi:16S rRNA (adenine1518-N6/adenine1519-N6)-dimethyltransferase